MYVSVGWIAAEKKWEKTGKRKCDASCCQSLNVSASNNLSWPANIVYLLVTEGCAFATTQCGEFTAI